MTCTDSMINSKLLFLLRIVVASQPIKPPIFTSSGVVLFLWIYFYENARIKGIKGGGWGIPIEREKAR